MCKAKGKYIQAAKDVILCEIGAWLRYLNNFKWIICISVTVKYAAGM